MSFALPCLAISGMGAFSSSPLCLYSINEYLLSFFSMPFGFWLSSREGMVDKSILFIAALREVLLSMAPLKVDGLRGKALELVTSIVIYEL